MALLDLIPINRRWRVIIAVCAVVALVAWWIGLTGYLGTWILTSVRMAAGAAMGWVISRHVVGTDLSKLKAEYPGHEALVASLAGLSRVLLIAAGMLAMGTGV